MDITTKYQNIKIKYKINIKLKLNVYFLKCFENNFKLEMLINELGRLFQYFTPIFVKRNRFLEVLDAFLINLLQ